MNQVDQLYVDAMQGLARISELERDNTAKHYRIVELEAENASLRGALADVFTLQKIHCGDGIGTHIALSRWEQMYHGIGGGNE